MCAKTKTFLSFMRSLPIVKKQPKLQNTKTFSRSLKIFIDRLKYQKTL